MLGLSAPISLGSFKRVRAAPKISVEPTKSALILIGVVKIELAL